MQFAFCALHCDGERGFSLLELLVVLALLGVAALIVVPSIESGLRDREVKQAALALAALARDLRSRAIYDGALQSLVLNPAENSIQASAGKRIVLTEDVRIAAVDGGEPMGSGARQFLFFPNGSAVGGEIGIAGRPGSAYTIRLQPLTGRVQVLRGSRQ